MLFALQARPDERGVVVNDIHSQLNPTRVREVVSIASVSDLQRALRRADSTGQAISVAGGRHAMGAQQFAEGSMMLDMTRFNRVLLVGSRAEASSMSRPASCGRRWSTTC